MSCGVYKITNLLTNKSYIGVSIHIEQRWKEHLNGRGSKQLYKDFFNYGVNNFSFEILEECKEEELYDKEPYWIKYYNSYLDGYNQNPGGDGNNLQAISVTKKKIYCYDLDGNFIKEYDSLSDAERDTKIDNSNISRAAKTNGRTKEFIWSYEYQDKKEPYKRKCHTGTCEQGKHLIKVCQYTKEGVFIKTFNSISEAARETGANGNCIGEICKEKGKGKRKTSGGYIWRYEGDKV